MIVIGASQPATTHGIDAVVGDRDRAANTHILSTRVTARHNTTAAEATSARGVTRFKISRFQLTASVLVARLDAPPCFQWARSSVPVASPDHLPPTTATLIRSASQNEHERNDLF